MLDQTQFDNLIHTYVQIYLWEGIGNKTNLTGTIAAGHQFLAKHGLIGASRTMHVIHNAFTGHAISHPLLFTTATGLRARGPRGPI